MVVTAWVMRELIEDGANANGGLILMRGDNTAESWISPCAGAKDKRACLLMKIHGRLEIKRGWNHTAKHIPGVRNTPADGISRGPRAILTDKVRELINSDDWSEQDIGPRGKGIFDTVLQTKNVLSSRHDDCLWDIISGAQPG